MNPEMDSVILGTVLVHPPLAADYEHIFRLCNDPTSNDWEDDITKLNTETEKRMYKIAQRLIEPMKQEMSDKFEILQEQYTETLRENRLLNEKVIKLESYSRRNNLKFIGLRSQNGESRQD